MWAFSGGMQVMRLIITEKPSMGRDVAAALGVTTRRDGYLEGPRSRHVVYRTRRRAGRARAYDPTWKQWRLADLPLFPATFTYHPCAKTLDQFTILGTCSSGQM